MVVTVPLWLYVVVLLTCFPVYTAVTVWVMIRYNRRMRAWLEQQR